MNALKSRWMILVGVLLISAGLVNVLWGYRQAFSPFDAGDDSGGKVVDLSLMTPIAKTTQTDPTESAQPGAGNTTPVAETPGSSTDELPKGLIPERLVIPAISVDAPIIPTMAKEIEYKGETYYQWIAPDEYAAGWHNTSALLGNTGNTVLNGHHNVYGKVFKDIINLEEGDLIDIYSGDYKYEYKVAYTILIPERYQTLTIRKENAKWISETVDERLTLITCWPPTSNTHRVIVVAFPVK
jgi:LPXTG-site transpeptidase (sortase) family protein